MEIRQRVPLKIQKWRSTMYLMKPARYNTFYQYKYKYQYQKYKNTIFYSYNLFFVIRLDIKNKIKRINRYLLF